MTKATILLAAAIAAHAGEPSRFAGRFTGSCSYTTNVLVTPNAWESRTLHRMVRPIDDRSLEILEWTEASSSAYPKVNLVFTPTRYTVKQTAEATFADAKGETQIQFAGARQKRVMKLSEKESSEPCFGKSLIEELQHDKADASLSPSFNCAKATQPREKAICANPELALLDQHLALAFRAADYRVGDHRQNPARRSASQKLHANQEEWWATQLKPCQDAGCVRTLYTDRIRYLDALGK